MEAESKGDLKKVKQIRQHQLNEELRQTYRNIKMVVNDGLGARYHMELTTEYGPRLSTDKDAIEAVLMNEYENEYQQIK